MAAIQTQKIILVGNDGITFEVPQEVAFHSRMIKDMCEIREGFKKDFEVNVPASFMVLKKLIDYCKNLWGEQGILKDERESRQIQLSPMQERYLNMPSVFLVELITAADYLDIPGLVDIGTTKLASLIDGKEPDEMRAFLQLPDDLAIEKKEEVQKKWQWVKM